MARAQHKGFLMKTWIATLLFGISLTLLSSTQAAAQAPASAPALAAKSESDNLLVAINREGTEQGLAFELFKPGKRTAGQQYDEMPVAIKVKGTRKGVESFIQAIDRLPNKATIGEMVLSDAAREPVQMTAVVKIYWER
jgi:Tfp pilus assembly protein PilO